MRELGGQPRRGARGCGLFAILDCGSSDSLLPCWVQDFSSDPRATPPCYKLLGVPTLCRGYRNRYSGGDGVSSPAMRPSMKSVILYIGTK